MKEILGLIALTCISYAVLLWDKEFKKLKKRIDDLEDYVQNLRDRMSELENNETKY